MFPILVWNYKRLARKKEQEALVEFGEEHYQYIKKFRDLFHALDNLQNYNRTFKRWTI
jgi:hypothetical protein